MVTTKVRINQCADGPAEKEIGRHGKQRQQGLEKEPVLSSPGSDHLRIGAGEDGPHEQPHAGAHTTSPISAACPAGYSPGARRPGATCCRPILSPCPRCGKNRTPKV
jgi:hypothetical protein